MRAKNVRSSVGTKGNLEPGQLPSISIVTASYKRGPMVEEAINSVLNQAYRGPLEHIVVDGASTDDTLVRLRKYPHLKVVSEPDQGVYDAYNKGVALATGELVGFLNDDDVYGSDTLNIVGETFIRSKRPDTIVGRAAVFEDRPDGRFRLLELTERPATRLSLETLNWATPILNARFFRASVFDDYGAFDARYRIEGDLDFMARLALKHVTASFVDHDVVWYRSHRGAITVDPRGGGADTYRRERLQILRRHLARRDVAGRDRAILRRLHTWQCCTAVAMLPKPLRPSAVAPFIAQGLARDVLFAPRLVRYAVSPGYRANPWRGVERGT